MGHLEAMAKQRLALPTVDAQLAATVLHHGLTFVTRNTADIGPTGVSVFDPDSWGRMSAMLAEPRAEQAPATYAAARLAALARDQAAGWRSPRLTEPGQATWQRFRGRLGSADLLRMLAEDDAVLHPVPFAASQIGVPLDDVDDALVDGWLGWTVARSAEALADIVGRLPHREAPIPDVRRSIVRWRLIDSIKKVIYGSNQ
jgi:hypothetical protein